MKAIFELVAAAARLDRAASAGEAVCDCALRPSSAKSATPTSATRVTTPRTCVVGAARAVLASSISASTRASSSSRSTGSLGRAGEVVR